MGGHELARRRRDKEATDIFNSELRNARTDFSRSSESIRESQRMRAQRGNGFRGMGSFQRRDAKPQSPSAIRKDMG
jgi:hypothetical protein